MLLSDDVASLFQLIRSGAASGGYELYLIVSAQDREGGWVGNRGSSAYTMHVLGMNWLVQSQARDTPRICPGVYDRQAKVPAPLHLKNTIHLRIGVWEYC